ncbi:Eco57I restriction-modification methylase domain-containing protein [Myroides indicus]|uniref:Type III restriction/modification enzyme restriction subunit n=1 Tax=Myroides indicus TaxID=1323422 RepID=A0A4R7F6J3_9FLAO|nr:Eco57I restriction-modification methylase domain-containing protein [Myroides indicus]TDS64400.1 type III restriction/modification enzyme restriction subunit [Myroides indicus]
MSELNNINVDILDNLIIGRVEPQIYAFTTETIPNYLKVGDTYRPLETRLNEWRKHFPNLEKKFENVAKVDDETFFRDYAVHLFLENDLKRKRLARDVFQSIPYYSNEFFENATEQDLQNAIKDIENGHKNNDPKYQYYRFDESHIPITHTYLRTENYNPRPNQQETINKFREAINKGRTNLLMYAVMRFGKSFTSMCCAVEMGAKSVVVVSAKADVKEEWKKTTESHIKFDGYSFLDSDSLLQSDSVITEKRQADERFVVFLTLQDLQGDEVKNKHKALFESQIDLLLIDETHFGARAEEYGKVLKEEKLSAKELRSELKLNDNTIDDLEITNKIFNAKIRIHLSGTPYRILMNSEFTDDDIIAFYQFTNIAEDQEKWDSENLNKDEVKEWDNPYYGFPQMVRFAFNPNESSRKKMEQLKKNGVTYAFSELFKPQSITKDNKTNLHKKFVHEVEILDLLKVIDGSETDENLLSFMDYDKIKEGKMCRHIVCVLPYRASCDSLEELINKHHFKHLSNYEIINISGVENERSFKDTQAVQAKIKRCESENIKTITLTVNRMLTGSTVPEWDTMLYLKDTSSPQEYDQAVFRLQNQYIKVYKEPNGDVVKFNMKPQTLLVDFNPNRMFQMQEHKSQIYNVNTEANGNSLLTERIKRELEISPIVVLNNNKMVEIQPTDILDAVRQYSNSRSVFDEATTISIDYSLLDIEPIKAEIERQGKIGSRQGIEVKASEGEGDEIEVDDIPKDDENENQSKQKSKTKDKEPVNDYKGQFAMYYARILFFAFLADSRVKSLQEIINEIEKNADNQRISNNLNLDKQILSLFQQYTNPFVLSELDYKIQNINSLANDTSISPIERASNAMKKFSRLSDSEIVTPETVTKKMVSALPKNAINDSTQLLDIASKQGEFVYAIYKKFGKDVANNFYSIPTSKIAYEFTRKVYNLLELDMKNIEANYTSYDLIKENNLVEKDTLQVNGKKLKFDVIVGNPPYQDRREGTSDNPIYHLFMDVSFSLAGKVILITPGRFLFNAGKTPNQWNEKMLNDKHLKVKSYFNKSSDAFPEVQLPGGMVITLRDNQQNFDKIGVFSKFEELNTILHKVTNAKDFEAVDSKIFTQNKFELETLYKDYPDYKNIIGSNGREKRLTTSIFDQLSIFTENFNNENDVCIFGLIKNKRTYRFIPAKYIEEHINTKKYKVILPKSNGSGALGEVVPTPLIGEPLIGEIGTGYTQSFISIGSFSTKGEAESCLKYIKTKFARIMLGTLKVTQDNNKDVWRYVPNQDFSNNSDIDWSKPIIEIDKQLYAKYNLSKEEIEFIESMIKSMSS